MCVCVYGHTRLQQSVQWKCESGWMEERKDLFAPATAGFTPKLWRKTIQTTKSFLQLLCEIYLNVLEGVSVVEFQLKSGASSKKKKNNMNSNKYELVKNMAKKKAE